MPAAISTSSPSSRPQAARRGVPSSRLSGRCRARLRGSGRAGTSVPAQQPGIRLHHSGSRGRCFLCQQMLAMPPQGTAQPTVEHLARPEARAPLQSLDTATKEGRRDRALLLAPATREHRRRRPSRCAPAICRWSLADKCGCLGRGARSACTRAEGGVVYMRPVSLLVWHRPQTRPHRVKLPGCPARRSRLLRPNPSLHQSLSVSTLETPSLRQTPILTST